MLNNTKREWITGYKSKTNRNGQKVEDIPVLFQGHAYYKNWWEIDGANQEQNKFVLLPMLD